MKLGLRVVVTALLGLSVRASQSLETLRLLGAQGVNLWKLEKAAAPSAANKFFVQDSSQLSLEIEEDVAGFKSQWFRQPVDHFSKSSNATYLQRYWVNTRHYNAEKGGPVIILDGGETSGIDRIPFLDTGIVEILARSTGGVGVVLEHRYYGKSIPVSNFTTDNLRWLNNDQSAADSANFMANVKFKGISEDLTAPTTPWIYYGGSYAGARAAHMKILYPDLVYGAIASSAVTHASIVNWEYMEIIRQAADPKCSAHLENAIQTIDGILSTGRLTRALKSLFGLSELRHDDDFASVIESPLGSWQSKCWHPDFASTRFDDFCTALDKPPFGSGMVSLSELPYGAPERMITLPGDLTVDFTILNYASYIKTHIVSQCPEGVSTDECFGTYDDSKYEDTDVNQDWRLWLFQVCTEWGYFTTAPPDPAHPRIVSKLLTLGYESKICRQAFPPGKHFTVPKMPNVTVVNVLGDFDIAADRLAIIDGEVDPWRPATPHSDYAFDREDTILRPFKMIPGGVHHYDEWGLPDINEEPPQIRKIHEEMIFFVSEWLKDWKAPTKTS
ncbi:serine carboxypeptidase S28-domain-containing protein [Mycena belliarum]|uniref:Serine carboxypeptidase S28-domain-containing protein n=1 Tax=Mycena belliarum TaxID=1033014 RepID=A0AAD6XPZ7_9AGAR|nr:serine carboxypeptidase S28-domain-containing protein [Mycena belliae]